MIGTSLLFSGSIAGLLGPGDIATPTAGYSLRPLSVSYSGSVVRVRRSGDNEEKDFNASGVIDGQLSDFLNVFTESGHILNVYEHFKRGIVPLTRPTAFYNFEDVSLVCNCIEEDTGLIAYDALQNMVSHSVAVYTDLDFSTINDPSLVSSCDQGDVDELDAFDDILNLTTQNDGFVVTWYDQFGSNDATQTTATDQPKIWDASTGLVTENGKPALDFDGVDDVLSITGALYSNVINVYSALKILTTTSTQPTYYQRIIHLANGTYSYQITRVEGSTNNYELLTKNAEYNTGLDSLDWGIHSGNVLLVTSTDNTTNSDSVFVDSVSQSEGGNNISIGAGNNTPSTFGARNDLLNTTFFDGAIQEIIIYNSDQSANRTKIEDNMNDYYDIY